MLEEIDAGVSSKFCIIIVFIGSLLPGQEVAF